MLLILSPAFVGWWGSSQEEQKLIKDLAAANAMIKVHEQTIAIKEAEIKDLKGTWEDIEARLKKSYLQAAEETEKTHMNEIQNYLQERTSLKEKLHISEMELMASRAALKQPIIIDALKTKNFYAERIVWIVISFIPMLISLSYAHLYYSLRKQKRENIVRVISELSKTK